MTGYIKALAASIAEHWMHHGRPDKLVMSFHGVPRYTLDKGDPYHCQCRKTARLVAEQLGHSRRPLPGHASSRASARPSGSSHTRSRLWRNWRAAALRSVDVVCPGFVADCLETLEEIAMENRDAFLAAGGKEFRYIPCLNERHDWIAALQDIVVGHLGNWLTSAAPDAAQLAACRTRATALGATVMKLLLRWALSAMALMLLPQIIDAIHVNSFYAALAAALFIGLVNALIRPILIIVTLPINILTLGLLTFVINGLLFWFVASFIKGFTVTGFWPAVFGAILYSVATWAINVILRDPRRNKKRGPRPRLVELDPQISGRAVPRRPGRTVRRGDAPPVCAARHRGRSCRRLPSSRSCAL